MVDCYMAVEEEGPNTENNEEDGTLLAHKTRDCVPYTIMLPAMIQNAKNKDPLIALLDSGSSHTLDQSTTATQGDSRKNQYLYYESNSGGHSAEYN